MALTLATARPGIVIHTGPDGKAVFQDGRNTATRESTPFSLVTQSPDTIQFIERNEHSVGRMVDELYSLSDSYLVDKRGKTALKIVGRSSDRGFMLHRERVPKGSSPQGPSRSLSSTPERLPDLMQWMGTLPEQPKLVPANEPDKQLRMTYTPATRKQERNAVRSHIEQAKVSIRVRAARRAAEKSAKAKRGSYAG